MVSDTIDYRALLVRYMDVAIDAEGNSFFEWKSPVRPFMPSELEVLRKIELEVSAEFPTTKEEVEQAARASLEKFRRSVL